MSGLIVAGEGLNDKPLVLSRSGATPLGDLFVSLLVGAAGTLAFCVVPGAYLLVQGDSVADRLFPRTAQELRLSIDATDLFEVLIAIVGVFFLVKGAMGLAGGAFYLVATGFSDTDMAAQVWQVLGSSIVSTACGLFLVRAASRARRAA